MKFIKTIYGILFFTIFSILAHAQCDPGNCPGGYTFELGICVWNDGPAPMGSTSSQTKEK